LCCETARCQVRHVLDLGPRSRSVWSEVSSATVHCTNGEAFPGLERFRVRTVSRALTMSYHPGMLMPKFCIPISYRSNSSMRIWESYHCDRYCRCIREYELDFLKFPPPSPILGQPNPRAVYQRDFIRPIVGFFGMLTSPHHCNLVSNLSCMTYECWRTCLQGHAT
jgi:hypothetical protein